MLMGILERKSFLRHHPRDGYSEVSACRNAGWVARETPYCICNVQGSSNHRDVCKCLTSLGRSYTSEDCSSGYAVDIAIPESRIAIEVDGPTHFTRNTLMPLGATAMKHRHLRKLGWKVLSVSYATWYELEDRAEKCRYLREALSRLEQ